MRRRRPSLSWLALAVLLTSARAVAADEEALPKPDGFDLAFRAGYGIPLGTAVGNTDLSALMSASVPLVFEIGKRFNRDYTLGVFFQYAVGLVREGPTTGCGPGMASCSSAGYRFGIEWIRRIDVGGSFTPWLGFDLGYEVLTINETSQGVTGETSLRGFEWFALQGGGEFRLTPTFSLGPYVSYSLGQYGTVSTLGGDYSVTSTGVHNWLQVGLRGSFTFSGPGD
jgi:hypothetical protein